MGPLKKNEYIVIDEEISYLIIFSPKYGKIKVIINTQCINKLKKYNWCIKYDKSGFRPRSGKIYLSRYLLDCNENLTVDHIDGNSLNNTIKNLRICTKAQNNKNQKVRLDTKYKIKGVYQHKNKKWRAKINSEKKTYHLGYFETKKEAILAYNDACLKLHGPFAKLNKIEED